MRFQMKLILLYSALIIVLTSILGVVFYRYSVNSYEQSEYERLQTVAKKAVQQFEDSLKPMEQISDYLLSDMDVLNAMKILANIEPDNDKRQEFYKESWDIIQSRLNSYYISKNFHRVIFFNTSGVIIASKDYSTTLVDKNLDVYSIPWLNDLENAYGEQVLIGPHIDDWSARNNKEVYSMVKKIVGLSMGYIEVQRSVEELNQLFGSEEENYEVVVLNELDQVFYSNVVIPEEEIHLYTELAANPGDMNEWVNPVTQNAQMFVRSRSDNGQIQVFLFKDKLSIAQQAAYIGPITLLMVCAIIGVSVVYIVAVSGRLTRPIRRLRDQIENTQLEHLGKDLAFHTQNDEVAALADSYRDVLVRLNDSIIKERRLSLLQLQAQFDTLQAQVNPHFLYNVLNVISGRAMTLDDAVISEICHNLAGMLRYSTNTKDKIATIWEELAYVEQYFYLLKARYEHKLQYKIDVDLQIYEEKIPKILLQQIVENCIQHGFDQTDYPMRITITGGVSAGRWYIQVDDNGEGFSEESIVALHEKMSHIKMMIMKHENNVEMGIGGMGIVNCYARLLLFKDESVNFEIKNSPDGATVLIGAKMEQRREDDV